MATGKRTQTQPTAGGRRTRLWSGLVGHAQGEDMLSEGRRRQFRVLLSIVLGSCTIVAAFSLAYLLRFYWEVVPAPDSPTAQPSFALLPVLVPAWIAIFAAYGLYRDRLQGFFDEALRVASAVSVGLMMLLAGSFFYRQFSYSRLWILFAWGLSIVLVLVTRGVRRTTPLGPPGPPAEVHPRAARSGGVLS